MWYFENIGEYLIYAVICLAILVIAKALGASE